MTDEGQRQLKVLDFSVEWYNLEHISLIQLHFLINRSPPLISLFYQPVPKCRLIKNPASPRGKPRGINHKQFTINTPRCPRSFGLPGWRPLQWLCKTIVYYHPTGYTPSASRSLSSSLREGAKGTSCRSGAGVRSRYTGWWRGCHGCTGTVPFSEMIR